MDEIIGIIPARYASSRFPGKPLAMIKRKAMIEWVYERSSGFFKHLLVATDDERIFKAVEAFGGNVVMTSPDHGTGTERCREALELARADSGIAYTHVVNIQGDEPLIETDQFRELMSCFKLEETEIATLIQPFGNAGDIANPNKVKVVVDIKGRALYFSRASIPFIRNGRTDKWMQQNRFYKHIGLYAYRSTVLETITQLEPTPLEQAESLEQLRWLENGYHIQTAVSDYHSIGVDTPEDLKNITGLMG